nr:MAG TPA: hypothetical protein [Caudoviricetes sp.]
MYYRIDNPSRRRGLKESRSDSWFDFSLEYVFQCFRSGKHWSSVKVLKRLAPNPQFRRPPSPTRKERWTMYH